MHCEERARLDQQLTEAKTRYQTARKSLETRIGVIPRAEFLRLSNAIDEAWVEVERAEYLLEQHTKEHGCEPCGETAAEA
jgi:hypothetical protein